MGGERGGDRTGSATRMQRLGGVGSKNEAEQGYERVSDRTRRRTFRDESCREVRSEGKAEAPGRSR